MNMSDPCALSIAAGLVIFGIGSIPIFWIFFKRKLEKTKDLIFWKHIVGPVLVVAGFSMLLGGAVYFYQSGFQSQQSGGSTVSVLKETSNERLPLAITALLAGIGIISAIVLMSVFDARNEARTAGRWTIKQIDQSKEDMDNKKQALESEIIKLNTQAEDNEKKLTQLHHDYMIEVSILQRINFLKYRIRKLNKQQNPRTSADQVEMSYAEFLVGIYSEYRECTDHVIMDLEKLKVATDHCPPPFFDTDKKLLEEISGKITDGKAKRLIQDIVGS